MENTYVLKHKNGSYIKYDYRNKITYTTNECLAQEFESYDKAKRVLNNCVPVKNRINITIVPSLGIIEKEEEKTKEDVPAESVGVFGDDLLETCIKFKDITKNASNRLTELKEELRVIELKFIDVRHRIEFPKDSGGEFNCCEGYKLFAMERDLLRKRRTVKNNIKVLENLISTYKIVVTAKTEQELSKFDKKIDQIANQKYQPRVFENMFI